MWQKIRTPLLFLSLGMNVAFLVVIGLFALPGPDAETAHLWEEERQVHDDIKHWKRNYNRNPGSWFYRHVVGVSDTQWQKIQPKMKAFHRSAYKLCKQIRSLRNEVLTLIQSPESDTTAIRKKGRQIIDLKRKKQRMFAEYIGNQKRHLTREQKKRLFGFLRQYRDCDQHARFLDSKDIEPNG